MRAYGTHWCSMRAPGFVADTSAIWLFMNAVLDGSWCAYQPTIAKK